MTSVGVRLACGIAPEGDEAAKVFDLIAQMAAEFGPPLRAGNIWIGDEIDRICAEIGLEMQTPAAGLAQIRAEWDRQRQFIHRPILVVVAAWYPPTALVEGEVTVALVPANGNSTIRADA